jgi:hypothetical protein
MSTWLHELDVGKSMFLSFMMLLSAISDPVFSSHAMVTYNREKSANRIHSCMIGSVGLASTVVGSVPLPYSTATPTGTLSFSYGKT